MCSLFSEVILGHQNCYWVNSIEPHWYQFDTFWGKQYHVDPFQCECNQQVSLFQWKAYNVVWVRRIWSMMMRGCHCPEWPEEEVRLDKWRSERGQKVIWTDLLYNEQYSSEGDKKAMNSKKHKKKSLLWITSYKPSSCPHRFIWLHYFLSIISIKPNAKSEVRRSHQGVHCLSLFWGKKGLDEQYVVRTKRTT